MKSTRCNNDRRDGVLVAEAPSCIPRPISSHPNIATNLHNRKRQQRQQQQRILLALPPSTNSPAIFKKLYQHSTVSSSLLSLNDTIYDNINSNINNNNNPAVISDVIPQILSFCDARTLSRASSVCPSWNAMANANELWTELCVATFGVLPSELTPSPDPTRILYVLSHLRLRETLLVGNSGGGSWRNGGGVVGVAGRNDDVVPIISGTAFRRWQIR
mmetsp:Transcript_10651/g.16798  ORF Transcript_10651/g.16798 Transcript_10651/m.16798 type:complete len:217 (-) Transcript_10651:803-1453(-)